MTFPDHCGVMVQGARGWRQCGASATHDRRGVLAGMLPLCDKHAIDAKTVYPPEQILARSLTPSEETTHGSR